MHPWHHVDLGKNAPDLLNAIIEIPKGSRTKYELDKESGLIRVDRVLFSAVFYPANYGFIPQTYCEDNDPLDVLVLGQESFYPLSILSVKPIGMMKMSDQGKADDKIIAVHADDPEYNYYNSIHELPPHRMITVQRFFEDYKVLEKKPVLVEGFGGPEEARRIIQEAIQFYQENRKLLHPQEVCLPEKNSLPSKKT